MAFEIIKKSYRNWKRYNETLTELSRLTSRDLDDLGIRRHDIKSVARRSVR